MIHELRLESTGALLDERYAAALAHGLADETARLRDERPELGPEIACIADDARALSMAGAAAHAGYPALCRRVASALSDAESIARPYADMQAFWADAERQVSGDSPYTFWDVYEHGSRRRLERTLAWAYGCEDAILVNSGMSALTVALEAAELPAGATAHVAGRGYFETTDLVDRLLRTRGVAIHDWNAEHAPTESPTLAVLEVADATPGPWKGQDALLDKLLMDGAQIVVDNSMFGPGARWADLPNLAERAIFVESTAKFIGRELMGGVIYGSAARLAPLRAMARATGQQLQAHAFHRLRPGEISAGALRLDLHRRNVALLLEQLSPVRAELALCAPPRSNFRAFDDAVPGGCVVFLRLPIGLGGVDARAGRHRALIAHWCRLARERGHPLEVRAGYAWNRTTVRCYEGQSLKQAGVDDYIRVSVGIEDAGAVSQLGELLARAIEEISP